MVTGTTAEAAGPSTVRTPSGLAAAPCTRIAPVVVEVRGAMTACTTGLPFADASGVKLARYAS